MVKLKMGVGTVMLNDEPYPDFDMVSRPEIEMSAGWIHVIPAHYFPGFPKISAIFCFENTKQEFINIMMDWLVKAGVVTKFNGANQKLTEERKFQDNSNTATKKARHLSRFKSIYNVTEKYLEDLDTGGVKSNDPHLLKKLANKETFKRHILHSSIVYKLPNYDPMDPSTDDVLVLNDGTFLANLSNPVPPYKPGTDWSMAIKSAHVPSGCLRLFDNINYGGIFLFLWGPNGDYPDISQFGFFQGARSLQQSP